MKSKFTAKFAAVICLASCGAVAQGDDRSLPITDSETNAAETSAVVAIPVTSGSQVRRDCFPDSRAVAGIVAPALI